jgi:hypothetical protein
MRSSSRRFLPVVLLAAVTAALVAASSASAAWTAVSERDGQNTDDPGVVRAADGTLHIVYRERQGADNGIRHRTLPAAGGAWTAPATVVAGWVGITNPDIEVVGGVPHAFWGGQGTLAPGDPTNTGRAWYASLSAGTWTRSALPMTFRQSPYASSQVTSAVAADGATPWIAWTGTGIMAIHGGLAQGAVDETNLSTGCCQYAANLERDAATGDLYLVWYGNETNAHGYYAQRIQPTVGDVVRLPSTATTEAVSGRTPRVAAAARTTGGVYTAYCDTYPSCTQLRVAGSSGPSLRRSAGSEGANPSKVWTAAAPDGRMWLAWGDNSNRIFVVRSNKALTRWSAVRQLGAPTGTTSTWHLFGDAARGPFDLFVNATAAEQTRTYHQRVLPSLSLQVVSVRRDRRGRPVVTLRSNDAGDAIAASIRLGRTTLASRTNGLVRFILPATTGKGTFVSARATKTGYVAASARIRIP